MATTAELRAMFAEVEAAEKRERIIAEVGAAFADGFERSLPWAPSGPGAYWRDVEVEHACGHRERRRLFSTTYFTRLLTRCSKCGGGRG